MISGIQLGEIHGCFAQNRIILMKVGAGKGGMGYRRVIIDISCVVYGFLV
jgi:hypothetical protein